MTSINNLPNHAPEPVVPNGRPPAERTGVLHMIGNAHLDPVWLWRWQEGLQAAKATFRAALDLMSECDDFRFTSSSAAIYEWIEQNDPAMFAAIAARVAEGRWQIAGGWWIQPDCNLPGGESFVRQSLYGQRYFRARLGVTARVGYNVDSFGHHAMLPQILAQSGMDSYVFMRPEPGEMGLPGRLFWWESDDGARVLALRIPYEYATWGGDLEKHIRRCASELKPPVDELMCFYGVGNHGGGPTRANLASIRRLSQEPDLPALRFSTPEEYFAAVRARNLRLPTVHGELQHHASGCYAAHSGVKRWNRQAENLLLAAEKFSVVATCLTGLPYPDLAPAWKNVLFNQFHDILAGTSIAAAYEDARDLYGAALTAAGGGLNHALQSIASNIAIAPEEGVQPLVVFNPHAWPVRANVAVELNGLGESDILRDDAGAPITAQVLPPAAIISGWRKTLTFTADLPPLGWRVYRVTPASAPDRPDAPARDDGLSVSLGAGRETDGLVTLENVYFRLRIDPQTGCIAGLYDKRHGVEVFQGPAARPVVIADASDAWGHGVYRFQDAIGSFAAASARLVEHGPVRAVLRVESAYAASRLTQEFVLYRDLELIDVRVTVDWREQHKLLKLRFPVNLNFLRATYEIPYGAIERPTDGAEEPGQSWIDLSGIARDNGMRYGVSLLNDGKYSFDIAGREMGLTVLRSPIYAHHHPTAPAPDRSYDYIDQGVQRFSYTILPHAGGWEQAGTVRRAAELNQPPIALAESFHPGALPQHATFLAVEPAQVVAVALKQAEEGDDLVIRCYETNRAATRAVIRLPMLGREIAVDFGPCEIKTLRVPRDRRLPVVATNLLEDLPGA